MRNRHRRGRNKHKYIKVITDTHLHIYLHNTHLHTHTQVVHFQPEYGDRERQLHTRFGSAAAQMVYFARLLRERYPSDITYRIFVDRRWDSLPAVFVAKKEFDVSYTATVMLGSKYHVLRHWCPNKGPKVITKSKKRLHRGKYRSATVTVDGVVLNTLVWNDSSLIGGISADLGAENVPVQRRMGRHTPAIDCPRMMFV